MAVKIERLAAKGVFDPPTYTQAMKVTGGQSILLISGQVAYDDKGQPSHPGWANAVTPTRVEAGPFLPKNSSRIDANSVRWRMSTR